MKNRCGPLTKQGDWSFEEKSQVLVSAYRKLIDYPNSDHRAVCQAGRSKQRLRLKKTKQRRLLTRLGDR
jgi:hypothetical protein